MSRFPVRIKPLEGESIWSFLLRLSKRNGISLLKLLNSIKTWEKRYVQKSDWTLIDFSPNKIINVDLLLELTGCSAEEILGTSFYNVLKIFSISDDLERSRFLSGMLSENYRYCPACLKSSPYHRLLWRVLPVTTCTDHKSLLLDRCLQCNEIIRLRDVMDFDICPHCGWELWSIQNGVFLGDWAQQKWMTQVWKTLLQGRETSFEPSEIAIRLLYILGGKAPIFDRKSAESCLPDPSVLPTLLQHARNTLSQKRTLHLSFLLSMLYDHSLSFDEFLSIDIPQSFVESLYQGRVRKADGLSCLAPWCNGYGMSGTLVKTGTSVKKRKFGETLLYYLVCTECGCEYALDENGEMRERTYFIEGYRVLSQTTLSMYGIKALARETGVTEDKIRRCIAYFSTRKGVALIGEKTEVESNLLHRVLHAIRKGETLKKVQAWNCWDSYQQFLTYRFHPKVMRTLLNLKRSRPAKGLDSAVNRERVQQAVEMLLKRDEDITIRAVAEIVGVSPETIRSWGGNSIIAKVKKQQRMERLVRMKELVYEKTDDFLTEHAYHNVTSSQLYHHLGIQRTVLRRIAPEVTAYISESIKLHNQQQAR